jgi:hypothetical protein
MYIVCYLAEKNVFERKIEYGFKNDSLKVFEYLNQLRMHYYGFINAKSCYEIDKIVKQRLILPKFADPILWSEKMFLNLFKSVVKGEHTRDLHQDEHTTPGVFIECIIDDFNDELSTVCSILNKCGSIVLSDYYTEGAFFIFQENGQKGIIVYLSA